MTQPIQKPPVASSVKTVAALFVEATGAYANIPEIDLWPIDRDARLYSGPYPVVAHPPCNLWGRFAHVNFARWGGEHNRPGNDQGCFEAALGSVRRWGGVLEHPAFTDAWRAFGLVRPCPGRRGWSATSCPREWVCEVWQSAYGHLARKRTWLLYCGAQAPRPMRWGRPGATHQIGFHDQRGWHRNKPTVSGKMASATPQAFRDDLITLAKDAA